MRPFDGAVGRHSRLPSRTHMVEGASDAAAIHFLWMPSALSIALIAFSAYSKEGLDALMHIWTAQIGDFAYDRKALAAHLVSAADGVSAYAAAHAKAFEPHAAWRRSSSLDTQKFWRPLDTRQSQSPEPG